MRPAVMTSKYQKVNISEQFEKVVNSGYSNQVPALVSGSAGSSHKKHFDMKSSERSSHSG